MAEPTPPDRVLTGPPAAVVTDGSVVGSRGAGAGPRASSLCDARAAAEAAALPPPSSVVAEGTTSRSLEASQLQSAPVM
jgi:hypothetical protein